MGLQDQIITKGIVLARTDFQEADRIITVLTPDHGKVKAIAKGVRRPKSKMAGGIELFSVSDFTFLPGRGELQTLVSSRLIEHFGNIVKDVTRTMLGYELLKRVNRVTEDAAGEEYFDILRLTLDALNNLDIANDFVELWFTMQLLKLTGHTPNLQRSSVGQPLEANQNYVFSVEDMMFVLNQNGPHDANLIKLLRLGLGAVNPVIFVQLKGSEESLDEALKLAKAMLEYHLHV